MASRLDRRHFTGLFGVIGRIATRLTSGTARAHYSAVDTVARTPARRRAMEPAIIRTSVRPSDRRQAPVVLGLFVLIQVLDGALTYWGVTRFGQHSGRDTRQIARELDLYNAANAEIAASLQVRYADVTAASRAGGDHADMLVGDGLHPSAAMYRRWVETIEPQARAALSPP